MNSSEQIDSLPPITTTIGQKFDSLKAKIRYRKAIVIILFLILTLPLVTYLSLQKSVLQSNASSTNSIEPELGSLTGSVQVATDSNASNNNYIRFTSTATPTPTLTSGNTLPSSCNYPYKRLVNVATTAQLNAAVTAAQPGDMIVMADGTYAGRITMTVSGTTNDMITLCGSRAAKIAGNDISTSDVVALKASYWNLSGFSVTGSVLGVHVLSGNHNVIASLDIYDVGQEAIELHGFSSDNLIKNNFIHDTGLHIAEYGEGIYIGTAKSNWCTYSNCQPDTSNRNQIIGNTFGNNVTAENIDIKEGSSGGTVSGNTFNGVGQAISPDFLDSWVDVKGSHYTFSNNTGSTARRYGFEVNKQVSGTDSGDYNTFIANSMDLKGGQYGIKVGYGSPVGTVVKCSNTVSNATAGLSNITCQP